MTAPSSQLLTVSQANARLRCLCMCENRKRGIESANLAVADHQQPDDTRIERPVHYDRLRRGHSDLQKAKCRCERAAETTTSEVLDLTACTRVILCKVQDIRGQKASLAQYIHYLLVDWSSINAFNCQM